MRAWNSTKKRRRQRPQSAAVWLKREGQGRCTVSHAPDEEGVHHRLDPRYTDYHYHYLQ